MSENVSLFDIIGPVMIGPSSSHTAGAVRLGLLAGKIYGKCFNKIKFTLYNSFAATATGHGTKLGLTGGVLGMNVDDSSIKKSLEKALLEGIEVIFISKNDDNRHPNSVDFEFFGNENMKISGNSIGAGKVQIIRIDGFNVKLDGTYNTIFMAYKDHKGVISAVSKIIQDCNLNIASLLCDREAKGEKAVMTICVDGETDKKIIDKIKELPDIYTARGIDAI